MQTNAQWARYRTRINRVIEYIHANPGATLSSDVLADVANLSPYHWHRIYHAITGETATSTVRRCRMHGAATQLLHSTDAIADIGARFGYPQVHSFTRTFKDYYGMAPGQFRHARKALNEIDLNKPAYHPQQYPVELTTKPAMQLAGLWHHGDFMRIGQTFEKTMALGAINGILPQNPVTAGVYFADPDVTDANKLTSFAGIVINAQTTVPDDMQSYTLCAGRYASMTHQGSYALLNQSYQWLFGCWLPASGEAVRNEPCCEIYLNNPINTDPQQLLTAICLPIE